MESRTITGFLVSVILSYMITGYATVITRGYGASHFSTPAGMQNVTQDRAIALVRRYCFLILKTGLASYKELIDRRGNDLYVDSSGFSYTDFKDEYGPFVHTGSCRGFGYIEHSGYRYRNLIPVTARVNFADVKTIEHSKWNGDLRLLDGNGHRLFGFSTFKSVTQSFPHTHVEKIR